MVQININIENITIENITVKGDGEALPKENESSEIENSSKKGLAFLMMFLFRTEIIERLRSFLGY